MHADRSKLSIKVCLAGACFLLAPLSALSANSSDIEARLELLDKQVQAQATEIRELRLALAKSEARSGTDGLPGRHDTPIARAAQKDASATPSERRNQLSVRGGYAHGSTVFAGSGHASSVDNSGQVFQLSYKGHESFDTDGYYVGTSLEHVLTRDLWGFWPRIALGGEFTFEYVENMYTPAEPSLVQKVQINQLMLSAAPKVRINGLGRFAPWFIPLGLVVSVWDDQSNTVFGGETKISPGVMTGVGLDYTIWRDIYAGVDFRYSWIFGSHRLESGPDRQQDNDSLDGLRTGAYLGVRF